MDYKGVWLLSLFLLSWDSFGLAAGGFIRMKREGPPSEYAILLTPLASLTLFMDLPHEYIAVRNSDLDMCYYVAITSPRRSALGIAAHVFKYGTSAFLSDFAAQEVSWPWVLHNTAAGSEVNFCKSDDRHVLLQSPGDTPHDQVTPPPGPQRDSRPPPNGDNPPVG